MRITFIPYCKTEDGGITVYCKAQVGTEELPTHFGMSVGKNAQLAERFIRAIIAGKAYTNAKVLKRGDGLYVGFDCQVRGRCLNADLRALGF